MDNKEKFLEILESFPQQIQEAAQLGTGITLKPFNIIVICGMGGSGLPGEIVKSVVKDVPVILVKDYTLPAFVNEKTLAFVVSYSGNTEETIELYHQALQRKAQMVVVASGGELAVLAKKDALQLINVPGNLPPRMALGYQAVPLLRILEKHGTITKTNWDEAVAFLGQELEQIKAIAGQFAPKIGRKTPIVYASAPFYLAAYKWKINFNENAKIHALSNSFPEMNHNEINAYSHGDYIVFMISDADDHPQTKKQMKIVAEIIEKRGVDVVQITSKGTHFLSRMFWTIMVGDWLSYYLAAALGVDPLSIPVIEDLKKEMKKIT